MEIDLATARRPVEAVRAEVCVVGGGIAGIILAHTLVRRAAGDAAGGRWTEASGRRAASVCGGAAAGEPHLGTRQGRFRALGGASLRWGRQLLPLPEDGVEWPVSAGELRGFQAEAERLLGVDALPYGAEEFFPAPVHGPGMLAHWGMFRRACRGGCRLRGGIWPDVGAELLGRGCGFSARAGTGDLAGEEGGRVAAVGADGGGEEDSV